MDVIRLRTLTYKSKLGFGYTVIRDTTVESLLKISPNKLVKHYFTLTKMPVNKSKAQRAWRKEQALPPCPLLFACTLVRHAFMVAGIKSQKKFFD